MPPKTKKKANIYKKPPPIPAGEILEDTNGRKWKIGPSIGIGGFGEIYSACEYVEGTGDKSDYPYVVKIEPIKNGPLFVECNFYTRNYNEIYIEDFKKSRGLSHLGMPVFLGWGEHPFQDGNKSTQLRFLVLERYGTDISKKFQECGRFPAHTVFLLGLQVLDVLDYIHSLSYIHADIKGANILLGVQPGSEHQAYLLDFGLAWKVNNHNYKPNAKSAHDGTLEYTSTDRHIGAQTMRGDLQILAFNMLHWLTGTLPWEGVDDRETVHEKKTALVENVRDRIQKDYPEVPDQLINFFEYINTLDMPHVPDHALCRRNFESYLTSVGKTWQSQLEFPLLANHKNTNKNDTINDTPINLVDEQINVPISKLNIVPTPAISQKNVNKNQRKPIKKCPPKKSFIISDENDKLKVKQNNQVKTRPIKRRSSQKHSTSSEDNAALSEINSSKSKSVQEGSDDDYNFALKVHKKINEGLFGDSNYLRPKRNIKPLARLGVNDMPVASPYGRNSPVKKLEKRKQKYHENPPDKSNIAKDKNTSKKKTIKLRNEKNKQTVETKKINVSTSFEVSMIKLDITNEQSTENIIENLTSPVGKTTKVIQRESLSEKIAYDFGDSIDQETKNPKSEKINKSTSLNLPVVKLKQWKKKKVNEVKEKSESENDDLADLPDVSDALSLSRSRNRSVINLHNDSMASPIVLKDNKHYKHTDKIEQKVEDNNDLVILENNDHTPKKSKGKRKNVGVPSTKIRYDNTIYDEHDIDRSTMSVCGRQIHVEKQSKTKLKDRKPKTNSEIEKVSSKNSEDDIININNNNERKVENIELEEEHDDINIHQPSIKNNRKSNKNRFPATISLTETSSEISQNNHDTEPHSKKNKINRVLGDCASTSRDAYVLLSREILDFPKEDAKEIREENDNNYLPKSKKKKKNNTSSDSSDAEVCQAKLGTELLYVDCDEKNKNKEEAEIVSAHQEDRSDENGTKTNEEIISLTDDIIENSVTEDQPSTKKYKKRKKKIIQISLQETCDTPEREIVDSETKCRKRKTIKCTDICTSESGDSDPFRTITSSGFQSGEANDDEHIQPKPKKKKKNTKSSEACTKSVDASPISSPSLLDYGKDDTEEKEGEPQAKKKKKDKISKSYDFDDVSSSTLHAMTRRNSSNVGKESKTITTNVTKQLNTTDIMKEEPKNNTNITKKNRKKTKAKEDSGSDGDFDSKYKSFPSNRK